MLKKIICTLICLLLATSVSGCESGVNSGMRKRSNQSDIDAVIAQRAAEEGISIDLTGTADITAVPANDIDAADTVSEPVNDTGASDTISEPVYDTGASDTISEPVYDIAAADTVAEPANDTGTADITAVPVNNEVNSDAELPEGDDTVDVDLTVLSSTLVYSEVYRMMMSPEDFIGKKIKMSGQYVVIFDEGTGKYYHACIISDATACCSQGIEFELTNSYTYPDDYPEEGAEICVIGTFDTYEEDDYIYCTLRNARIA